MLMSANDGRINHHVFVIGVAGQEFENTVENTAFGPSVKALIHDLPIAVTRRQITPGDARAESIKHRVDKQSIVGGIAADMAFAAWQMGFDHFPLVISQAKALHGSAPSAKPTAYGSLDN
jgi:hypothetical protein